MVLLTLDGWETAPRELDDTSPPPPAGRFTVSVGRFLAERSTWSQETQNRAGVHLDADEDLQALRPMFEHVSIVALKFSKMADGRPMSQARLLRRRLGFQGQVFARGPMIPDQFDFLRRCGFDGVEVSDDADLSVWRRALKRHRYHYQPDPASRRPVAT